MNPLSLLLYVLVAAAAGLELALSADQLSHVNGDPPVTHIVEFEVAQGDFMAPAASFGVLQIGLFASVAPVTCAHFLENAHASYKDTVFHRIIQDFVVQGGGMKMVAEGKTENVAFERFDDEEFVLTHDRRGRVSMANAGPNTNGCQFFITTADSASHLDGKHVVFGQLIGGFPALDAMNTVPVDDSVPHTPVYISKVSVTDLTLLAVPNVDSVSSGYSFLMLFCVVAVLGYAAHRYTSRRALVDLASFKM